MKQYTFKIVINEGNDEFWEDLVKNDISGCEEVKTMLEDSLFAAGFIAGDNTEVVLVKFEDPDAVL